MKNLAAEVSSMGERISKVEDQQVAIGSSLDRMTSVVKSNTEVLQRKWIPDPPGCKYLN